MSTTTATRTAALTDAQAAQHRVRESAFCILGMYGTDMISDQAARAVTGAPLRFMLPREAAQVTFEVVARAWEYRATLTLAQQLKASECVLRYLARR